VLRFVGSARSDMALHRLSIAPLKAPYCSWFTSSTFPCYEVTFDH
jgi:hypothetical protein